MSKRRSKAPDAEKEQESQRSAGELLRELEELRHESDSGKRGLRAWAIVLQAAPQADFPVVFDYAMEHGLVLSCEPERIKGQAVENTTWVNPLDGSEMVWIPAGPFYVGPDNTVRARKVKPEKQRAESKGFSLARFPVTNAQFKTFLDDSGYQPPEEHPNPELFLSHWNNGAIPKGKEKHPVIWVSFIDALHYCKWAGLTLPTEWLWEKAARGPDGRPYPWGTQLPEESKADLNNIRSGEVCAVGSYPRTRTPYGCEDMIGNVSEWCQPAVKDKGFGYMPMDWPEILPDTKTNIPYAAVRGSCFLRRRGSRMVASHRRRLSITRRNQWVGFRPALFLECRPAL